MLPDGVSQADFDDAIGELREALGPNAVIVQEDALYSSYTDAYTPRQLADNAPSAAVAPRGRVPAIGRIVTLPARARTSISGLEPATEKSPKLR